MEAQSDEERVVELRDNIVDDAPIDEPTDDPTDEPAEEALPSAADLLIGRLTGSANRVVAGARNEPAPLGGIEVASPEAEIMKVLNFMNCKLDFMLNRIANIEGKVEEMHLAAMHGGRPF